WAFSATGSIEGQYAQLTTKLVSFSEQELVDCSGEEGDQGCSGGLMDNAFTYLETHGLEREVDYPYKAEDRTCAYAASKGFVNVTSFTDIKKGSSLDLISACADKGTISVAMDASHMSFQLYDKGVYDPWLCSNEKLDHGVLMVGYENSATDKKMQYYIIKNSWGDR
ncbi:C1 family peptidase, partial [Salmonella sp. s54836]|uniref:C1 family peptidase n=1 Tax=Salmonella sp. s54836 TaxID=3159673 RepID=UPI00398181BA